ncbi:carbohydrate ABC transporter permease [Mesorhizobium retamae]|uniref:Sugar ABC transporter permease n=1 Tax=Mesorhizobium retamae TaxID=2912854 RepID=A0ABS9QD17_9HYPH|nr:sugar ABC transporter permease [Mesorhizobium sp. IRAMC:0171]MCG7504793.1 sugar ABC transporter permease [Mesorhizobium sp. IRAMC:0171]
MADTTMTARSAAANPRATLQDLLPKIVLAPSFAVILIFVYGFIAFTAVLSFSGSKLLPDFSTWVGFGNYVRLFNHPNWIVALKNLAIFSILYIVVCSVIGLALAIFLDQKIRGEGVLRPIYLYPMALSFIVTGVAWKWFLDPGIGLEHVMQSIGWESFSFRWIKDGKMAIYTIVIAAVWQSSGFVMAMFLAGLRGVDNEIIKAAQIDGASTLTIYRRIIIPLMRPVFLSAFVVLAHLAIKSYDLVVAMTDGGPGTATWTPALFMQKFTFGRNEMGMGAASAIVMMMMIFTIIVPYLYSELGGKKK